MYSVFEGHKPQNETAYCRATPAKQIVTLIGKEYIHLAKKCTQWKRTNLDIVLLTSFVVEKPKFLISFCLFGTSKQPFWNGLLLHFVVFASPVWDFARLVLAKTTKFETNLAFKRFENLSKPLLHQFSLKRTNKQGLNLPFHRRTNDKVEFNFASGDSRFVNFKKNTKAHLHVKIQTLYAKENVHTLKFYLGLKIQGFFFDFAWKFRQETNSTSHKSTAPKVNYKRACWTFKMHIIEHSHMILNDSSIGRDELPGRNSRRVIGWK